MQEPSGVLFARNFCCSQTLGTEILARLRIVHVCTAWGIMSSPHTAQLQPSLAPSSTDPAQEPWQAFSRLASLFLSPQLDGTTHSQVPLLSRVDTAPKPSPRRAPVALEKLLQHSESPASNLSLPLEKAIFPQNFCASREQRGRGPSVRTKPGQARCAKIRVVTGISVTGTNITKSVIIDKPLFGPL